jgi:rod shape-determining protein MreC
MIKGTVEEGILNGERSPVKNQPFLKLRYLSKECDIRMGDTIVSSGIGEVFRKNLLLGRVKDSRRGVIDTEATIVPSVDFEKLVDVFIIMPSAGRQAYSVLSPQAENSAIRISGGP